MQGRTGGLVVAEDYVGQFVANDLLPVVFRIGFGVEDQVIIFAGQLEAADLGSVRQRLVLEG